jgi:serine/threonine protein kinase
LWAPRAFWPRGGRPGAPGGITADVYGLAATLFHALTGKNPRDAATVTASTLAPAVPAALDDVLVRALDGDPARRQTSADDLADELVATGLDWTDSWPIERLGPVAPVHPGHEATIDADAPATRSHRARREAPGR